MTARNDDGECESAVAVAAATTGGGEETRFLANTDAELTAKRSSVVVPLFEQAEDQDDDGMQRVYKQVVQDESPPPPTTTTTTGAGAEVQSLACSLCAFVVRIRGILFAFLAAFCFSLSGIFVKKAYALNSLEQICVICLVTFVAMLPIIRRMRLPLLGAPHQRRFLVLRGTVGLFAIIFFYSSLMFINPSDALAISNASLVVTACLARCMFGDKIGIAHLVSIVLIVVGVILIAKPTFIFPTTKNDVTSSTSSNVLIGVLLAVAAAISYGFVNIILKKLAMLDTHWSLVSIYIVYFGLPVCAALSLLFWHMGFTHTNSNSQTLAFFAEHAAYSLASGAAVVVGFVALNKAFACDDATKVSIAKTTEVFFSALLQLLILGVHVDVLSMCGSVAIFVAIVLVVMFKLVDDKRSTRAAKKRKDKKKRGALERLVDCLFVKF